MFKFHRIWFWALSTFLVICSFAFSANYSGRVSAASSEIIVVISILAAAVISSIFTLSRNIILEEDQNERAALILVSRYWVRFFIVCALGAWLVILGALLSWPSIRIGSFSFDVIGFLVLSVLSILSSMVFLDFPKAVSELIEIAKPKAGEIEHDLNVPEFLHNHHDDQN